jgi:hypothetical protein
MTAVGHRDISVRCRTWSLSGHSGRGRNCCALDPVAIDPQRSFCNNGLWQSLATALRQKQNWPGSIVVCTLLCTPKGRRSQTSDLQKS